MKPVTKIEFTARLVKEYSITPQVEDLGVQKMSMELWTNDGTLKNGCGDIEWIVDIGTKYEDVGANIGVWWDCNKTLTEYDGVFSLPKEAIKLLRKCGIKVPKDFVS